MDCRVALLIAVTRRRKPLWWGAFMPTIPTRLGSSCIYPREASQPMKEEALVTGTGVDCTIRELAQTIALVSGFKGKLTLANQGSARLV